MVTDRYIAGLVSQLYAGKTQGWYFVDNGDDDGIVWGAVVLDGVFIAVFRGTVNAGDALRDIDFWPCLTRLGAVHWGFHTGVWKVAREILSLADGMPIIVAGHSLGAARASIAAGYLTVWDKPPIARVVWGEPRPAFMLLRRILKPLKVSRSYRNTFGDDCDPVTMVPFKLGPFAYQHPTEPIALAAPNPGLDPIGLHRFATYLSLTPDTNVS